MKLFFAEINKECIVKSNNITNHTVRMRLLDMGLYSGASIRVLDRRRRKKNMLVAFNGVKYMFQTEIANAIEVEYA